MSGSNAYQRTVTHGAWYVIGGFFLFAAAGKLLDVRGLLVVLTYLTQEWGLKPIMIAVLAGLLISWETFLGLCAIFRYRQRWIAIALLVTLTVFTGALLFLMQNPKAPGCGCTALVKLASDSHGEARLGVARNVAMIWMIVWTLISWTANTAPRIEERRDRARCGHEGSPAFTLVEVLVTIAVIAILVGLAAPSLRRAREAAKDTTSVVVEAQCVAALSLYAHDYKDAFPYFQTVGNPEGPIVIGDVTLRHAYFRSGALFWPNLLFPTYLADGHALGTSDRERIRESNAADGYPADFIRSRYWLTNTAHAANAYWVGEDEATEHRLMKGMRLADVMFPSQKGLILDIEGGVFSEAKNEQEKLTGTALVGFADGAARSLRWQPGEPGLFVRREFGAANWQVMTTASGLAGRDLAR